MDELKERARFLLRDWDGVDSFHCFNISAPMVSQLIDRIEELEAINRTAPDDVVEAKFQMGDKVTKISGSNWTGRVVGTYSTALTPEGYAVESAFEKGSVQIYPAKALRHFYSEAARKAALQSRPSPDSEVVEAVKAIDRAEMVTGRGDPEGAVSITAHGWEIVFEAFDKARAALQSRPADNTGLVDDGLLWDICRDVAELPDRDSPEDWPEAMLVTADELHCILVNRLTALRSNHDEVVEFAKAVLHGDEEHQAWLTEAAECWVAGKPLPKPRNIKESSNV